MNYLNYLKKPRVVRYNTWYPKKKDTVDLELKEDTEPICSIPYPVPKLHEEMF